MKLKYCLLAITALLQISIASQAADQKYEQEATVNFSDKTSFKISAGWSFDKEKAKLTSPEGDLKVFLFEKPAQKDFEAQSLETWKQTNPSFSYKIHQTANPPAKDGWEEAHQVVYEVPVKDNKTVLTTIRVFNGVAYILLLDAANSGLAKRASQLQIVADTWRPSSMKKEDLSKNPVHKFGKSDEIAFDSFISKAMSELSLPGVSVAIVQDGNVVYKKGFGVKALGSPEPVTPETLFMIGSTTKPLTTLLLAKLVENGKLTWDTPINQVLPEFRLASPEITNKFQVKHTACACTGMPRRDYEFVIGSLDNSLEDSLNLMHDMKPTTSFGETFQYSNHLVSVGGMVGGVAYGKGTDLFVKYQTAMTDLIFTPMGMSSTTVKPTVEDLKKVASPHSRGFDGKMVRFPQQVDDMVYPVAPAGSVWSNVDDLAKYVLVELNKGKLPDGKRVFSEEQILKRREPGVKIDDNTRYGLGLFVENNKGVTVVGHAGNTMGFTHELFFLPDQNIGMVIQTNAGSVNGLRNSLKQKALEVFLGARPKSDEILEFSKTMYKQMGDKVRERVSVKPGDVKWITKFIGNYENKDLGKIKIEKKGSDFVLLTKRWESKIGVAKEKNGDKLLSLISAPWSGGFELRPDGKNSSSLVLDDDQVKYEFKKEKK